MKELIAKIRSLPRGKGVIVYWPGMPVDLTTDDIITLADRLAAYEEVGERLTCAASQVTFAVKGKDDLIGPLQREIYAFRALKGETNNAG